MSFLYLHDGIEPTNRVPLTRTEETARLLAWVIVLGLAVAFGINL